MGFNSVIFMCNDAHHVVDENPAGWWDKAKEMLSNVFLGRQHRLPDATIGEFGFGHHANGFQAVWNQHADVSAVIIAGENWAEVPATFIRRDGEDRKVVALKALAEKLGYEVRKKRS